MFYFQACCSNVRNHLTNWQRGDDCSRGFRGHSPPCAFTLYLPLKGVLTPLHTHTDTVIPLRCSDRWKTLSSSGVKDIFLKGRLFIFLSSGWGIGRILMKSNPSSYLLSLQKPSSHICNATGRMRHSEISQQPSERKSCWSSGSISGDSLT